MQQQPDAFEKKKSFSALDTRTGLGEGTEQQRARSFYLTAMSFGMGQGEQLRADGASPGVRVGESPAGGDSRAAGALQVTVPL